ncbi:hypothetical protein LIA77_11392 [Sarocladium implicatum]|nr:hypothetical protein LIA77_11392 [Sarocladium implicatum]
MTPRTLPWVTIPGIADPGSCNPTHQRTWPSWAHPSCRGLGCSTASAPSVHCCNCALTENRNTASAVAEHSRAQQGTCLGQLAERDRYRISDSGEGGGSKSVHSQVAVLPPAKKAEIASFLAGYPFYGFSLQPGQAAKPSRLNGRRFSTIRRSCSSISAVLGRLSAVQSMLPSSISLGAMGQTLFFPCRDL